MQINTGPRPGSQTANRSTLEIGMSGYRRILVAVDGSPTSNKALVAALQMARDSEGRVRLVHVIDELAFVTGFEYSGEVLNAVREGAQKLLAEAADIARASGVTYETHLVDAPGVRLGMAVADEARRWEADLVVLGTHGRRGFDRWVMGSGAEQILRFATVPVLVIRGTDKESS
jgi:nucleotide-binding universal stress UspA family protein